MSQFQTAQELAPRFRVKPVEKRQFLRSQIATMSGVSSVIIEEFNRSKR